MEEMSIRLNSLVEDDGQIRARLRVEALDPGVRIWLEVNFSAGEDEQRADWIEEAYSRALSVLDPA